MATTRIMPLHVGKGRTESRAISDIIDYVANPQKTDNGKLITGYACDSRTADAEFLLAKRQYIAATGRVRGADDVIAYHVRQSFRPGEITPEEANRLGVEFAKRFTKGNHAFVVCTHIDKSHIHNHIIWSSVSLEYDRKFRNFWGSTKAVRRLSDTICIENGLSIVENPKPHGKSYNKWLGDQAKPSHRELLRVMIDRALEQNPADFDALLKLLSEVGCEVSRRGKAIRLKAPGWKNVARMDDKLGAGYSEAEIRAVLAGEKQHTPRKKNVVQPEPPKVNLLVDIQAKLQAGKGAGYARWAKVFNLKQMAQTMGDCTALERVFSNAIPQLFGTIFMFIITAIGLLVLDWRMGLCIVVPVPVAALVVFAAKKAQSNAESANMDAKRAAYDGVQEYLDTIQELKSCSREEEYLEGLEKKLDYVVKCSFRNEIAPGAATTTAQFILRFGLVAVMLVGGILVTTGSLSIPMFILFLLFAGRIYDPFTSCFMLMAEVFSALVSVKRMKQIDATPEQTGTNVCNNKGYDIEFKNVVFSYNEEPVLKGVSFVAKQGEVTALVGPSGSGKSTASKLAARFWDADSGTITLGGVDVKTVEPETLFKNYAIVFQDVMLFDETVMENIRLGRGDATDEEVMAAARAAQCEEFIQRLPQGYQTNIGENGSALSGGERQRISIARALLKNAPIVLLDEATASMDAESETLIQDALSVLLKDKTVMVIAHRMRTVANADKIVVLDDGKVSEMGTPAELMKKGGLYAHLVELQQGK